MYIDVCIANARTEEARVFVAVTSEKAERAVKQLHMRVEWASHIGDHAVVHTGLAGRVTNVSPAGTNAALKKAHTAQWSWPLHRSKQGSLVKHRRLRSVDCIARNNVYKHTELHTHTLIQYTHTQTATWQYQHQQIVQVFLIPHIKNIGR